MEIGKNQFGGSLYKCDACGEDTRVASGDRDRALRDDDNSLEGHFYYSGSYGSIKYDFETWKAELCESCSEEVRELIDRKALESGARGVLVVNDLEADEAFCQEVLGKPASAVVRGNSEEFQAGKKLYGPWFRKKFKAVLPSFSDSLED